MNDDGDYDVVFIQRIARIKRKDLSLKCFASRQKIRNEDCASILG